MVDLPSAPPTPGQPAPKQAPFGGSPAVQPTPNRGFEMAGKQKVAMALKVLQDALPLYGASSDEGQVILDCLRKLGKVAQPGDVSETGKMNQLQQMMLAAAKQGQQQKQLQAQPPGAGGAPGGAPPPQAAA